MEGSCKDFAGDCFRPAYYEAYEAIVCHLHCAMLYRLSVMLALQLVWEGGVESDRCIDFENSRPLLFDTIPRYKEKGRDESSG